MDTRKRIKNRKGQDEEKSNRKREMKGRKALFMRKDKVIRRNDIIVNSFVNKVKLEGGESASAVKQEEREEEDVRREEGVEVVTMEENVDLSEDPCVEGLPEQVNDDNGEDAMVQDSFGEASGEGTTASSALSPFPEAGPSHEGLRISLDPTGAATPLEEKVNYLVRVVGSMGTELEKVKEKLSKVSPEIPPQHPSSSIDTSFQDNSPNVEASEGGVGHLHLAAVSSLASEDGTRSKYCLVCYKDVPSSSEDTRDDRPLIDKQLQAIFFLNKLLCVPPTSLGKYLEMCPDANPASWINLCSECRETVAKAWRIHDEMVNASKKLKAIQEEIIKTIKSSTIGCQESSDPQVTSRDVGTVITQESRKFVNEHDYGHFLDPFPDGDLEASRLLTEAKRRSEAEQSAKSKRTQPTEVALSEVDDPRQKNRKTKSRKMISRRKKSQKRLIDEKGAFYREDGKMSFQYPVKSCSKVFKSPQNYRAHKLQHSGKKPKYSCDQCDKVLTSRNGLFYHKKTIHEKNLKYRENAKNIGKRVQRKCPHCDLITGKYSLAFHIKRVHEKAFAVSCEVCGSRYDHRNGLERHQAASHGICPVDQCQLEFPGDRRGLWKHQLEAHGREINVFGCEDCGKLFPVASILRKHQRNVHRSQRI